LFAAHHRKSQLLSFNFFYGTEDRQKLMPGIFCLLGGKSQKLYEHVLDQLLNMATAIGKEVAWKKCLCDFEIAIRNSMQTKVPGVEILGCYFHFTKNIYAHIKGNKFLMEMYTIKRSILKSLVRDIMALAFIPLAVIQATYTELISLYREKFPEFFEIQAVSTFLPYIERQWMKESTVKSWNLFERDGYRTNNFLEGFHWFLQCEIGVHPDFWSFIKKTKVLYAKLQREYEGYRDKATVSSSLRRKRARTKDDQLLRLKDGYRNGEWSVQRSVHYLQRIRLLHFEAEFQFQQTDASGDDDTTSSTQDAPNTGDGTEEEDLQQYYQMDEAQFLYTFEGYEQATVVVSTEQSLIPVENGSDNNALLLEHATTSADVKPTLAAGRSVTFVYHPPFAPCEYIYGLVVSVQDKCIVVEAGNTRHTLQSYESVCCDINLSTTLAAHAEFCASSQKLNTFDLLDSCLPSDDEDAGSVTSVTTDTSTPQEDLFPQASSVQPTPAKASKFKWTCNNWHTFLDFLKSLPPQQRPWHNPRWEHKISKSNDTVVKFRESLMNNRIFGRDGKVFHNIELNELKKKSLLTYTIATQRYNHCNDVLSTIFRRVDGYHTDTLHERFHLQNDLSITKKTYKLERQNDDEFEYRVSCTLGRMFLEIGRSECTFQKAGGMAAHPVREDTEQMDVEELESEE
jgi:hypothetical protein